MFRYKDSFQKKIHSNIVYRYICSNCKVTYYGKTYRQFFTRASKHMGISNLAGKGPKSVKQSAGSDYLLECNCSIDFNHFDILASDFLLKKVYWLSMTAPVQQNHHVISVKTFWLRPPLIDFVRVGILLWNTETDKKCIVVELYQFLNIYHWLARIFNSSDDAFLVREKRQKFEEKPGLVDWICI